MNYEINYIIYIIVAIFLILFLLISLDKTIKIIIGNYLLLGISLALILGINTFLKVIDEKNVGFLQNIDQLQVFLLNNKQEITIIIYFFLLIYILTTSSINIGEFKNPLSKFLFNIIFSPLALISLISTIQIIFIGEAIFSSNKIIELSNNFSNPAIKNYILLTPLWIALPGFTIIIFSSKFNLNLKKSKKKKDKKEEENNNLEEEN